MQSSQSEYYCIYCKDNDVVVDTTFGDAICRGCGLVVCERMASLEAEWHDHDGDGDDTRHKARASKAGDFDDGTIFFTGGLRTKQEKDLLTKIQNQFSTKEQRMVEKLSDISELTYKLGLGSQIKVSSYISLRVHTAFFTLIFNK
jgi:transcription initiation factor TFIIIB Brf1 subunit/transcription initiation factor TFIIB